MHKGVAPNLTDQDIDQRRTPRIKVGIIDHSCSINNCPAARPHTAHRSSDSDTHGQEDEHINLEGRGWIKVNRGGIQTEMEPFHFDLPDFRLTVESKRVEATFLRMRSTPTQSSISREGLKTGERKARD